MTQRQRQTRVDDAVWEHVGSEWSGAEKPWFARATGTIARDIKTWITQSEKQKALKTSVVSVLLWTVRCGQRTKQSRLRRRSARRNQSISSKNNKWKNAADELLFISGRSASLERLGKSSPTGSFGLVNVVWWETAASDRSCNVSQRSVWISGQYVKAQPVKMTAEWCGNTLSSRKWKSSTVI